MIGPRNPDLITFHDHLLTTTTVLASVLGKTLVKSLTLCPLGHSFMHLKEIENLSK